MAHSKKIHAFLRKHILETVLWKQNQTCRWNRPMWMSPIVCVHLFIYNCCHGLTMDVTKVEYSQKWWPKSSRFSLSSSWHSQSRKFLMYEGNSFRWNAILRVGHSPFKIISVYFSQNQSNQQLNWPSFAKSEFYLLTLYYIILDKNLWTLEQFNNCLNCIR